MSENPTPAEQPHPVLPHVIKVVRGPGDPTALSVLIDGVAFPWMIAAEEGAKVVVGTSEGPGVYIKLVARSIIVEDSMYGLVDLAEPEPVPLSAVEDDHPKAPARPKSPAAKTA